MEVPPVVPPVSAEDSAKPEAEPAGAEPAAETNNNKRGREEDGEGADVDQMRKRPSFVTPSDAEPPGVEVRRAESSARRKLSLLRGLFLAALPRPVPACRGIRSALDARIRYL